MIRQALGDTSLWEHVDDRPMWADFVENLRTEVLDDDNHDMHEHLMDLPAEHMAKLPNYFTAMIEDPSPDQLEQIGDEIESLLIGSAEG